MSAGASLPAVRYAVGDIAEMAKSVSRSRLFGLDESQAFTLMLLAESKGLHPIQAVERYHVIKGRPSMKADAMLAEFQRHGGVVEWLQYDTTKCEAIFEAPNVKTPTKVSWTIEDARKAGLVDKDGMYMKYPRQMLRARVISEGVRMTMPGIILGIYTPEEVADFAPTVQREARVVEEGPPPDNASGYGRGQYASPEQVEAYSQAIRDFVDAKNAQWLDEWTGEDGIPDGIGELLRTEQVTGHLLKWGLRTERLKPVDMTWDHESGKPVEKVSVGKAKRYVAILHAREPEELAQEAEVYARQQAAQAREDWATKRGRDEETEGELAEALPSGREPGEDG
jgi:hypothetical protein